MHRPTLILALVCLGAVAKAEPSTEDQLQRLQQLEQYEQQVPAQAAEDESGAVHSRPKRTLLLKKKLIGAGLLGLGVGFAKGYGFAYHTKPKHHHVIFAPPPPPVFIEKPIFVPKYIEKPVFVHSHEAHPHFELEPDWHHHGPPPSVYGPW